MGRAIKKIAIGAVLIGAAFVTGGATILPAISSIAGSAALGAALSYTALGGVLLAAGATQILGGLAQAAGLGPKIPKISPSQLNRLNASIDPGTPRKMVFGETAMAVDVRYVEPSGSDQEYIDWIVATASHTVESIDSIYIEDKLAWTASGGVQGEYTGYLTVATRLVGTSANTISINGGAKWGSTRRLTGCAYVHLRFKRTGNSKKAESPFAGGIPSRMTIKGKGAKTYDPRQDTTVGGSGAHRADDQTTWTYGTHSENPALQILWYLLGWKIQNPADSTWKLAVGRGIPVNRIDIDSFITAANICDELVAKADASTEKRYRAAGVFSEADQPTAVLQALLTACNGTLRDAGGRLSIHISVNDLSTPAIDFSDSDILGGFSWDQTPSLDQAFNVVRGRYTDPSTNSLYQMVDFPEVRLASPDGIDRVQPLDLPLIQSPSQAQRIAKQWLQRNQYQGVFAAEFGARAWACKVGDVVTITFATLGWTDKLFRVIEQTIRADGVCPMVLREEHADIYAWDAEEAPAVQAAAPTIYDPLNAPLILGTAEAAALAEAAQVTADQALSAAEAAALAAENAQAIADGKIQSFYQDGQPTGSLGDFWVETDNNNVLYRHFGLGLYIGATELTIGGTRLDLPWLLVRDQGIASAIAAAAGAQATADGKVTTFYATTEPTAEALGDLWYNATTGLLKRWNGTAWEDAGSLGAPSGTNVGSTPATTVEAGGNAANAGLNADGTVKTDKVSTTAVQTGSITAATIVTLASTHVTATGAVLDVALGTIPTGTTAVRVTAIGNTRDDNAVYGSVFDIYLQRSGVAVKRHSRYEAAGGDQKFRYDDFNLVYVDTAPTAGTTYRIYLDYLSVPAAPNDNRDLYFTFTQIIVEYFKR